MLDGRGFGLLLDLDGTLSELVPNPEDSVVSPEIKDSLAQLCRKLALVAVITGRSIEQARRILAIDDLLYVGSHGLEWWERGKISVPPEVQSHLQAIEELRLALQPALPIPGVSFEDKGVSFAIHYRNAADPKEAGRQVQAGIERMGGRSFKMVPGKMVINILPPVDLTKGTAVLTLAAERNLQAVVYIGDDVTDLDAFRAVDRLDAEGRCRGLKIGVVGEETPRAIPDEADYIIGGVSEVGWFLDWLTANVD